MHRGIGAQHLDDSGDFMVSDVGYSLGLTTLRRNRDPSEQLIRTLTVRAIEIFFQESRSR